MAGSKPGERRGGRKAGTPNKATAEVRRAAGAYTAEALETLASIMRQGQSETARISAATALLDRAHGKPTQAAPQAMDESGLDWMDDGLGRLFG